MDLWYYGISYYLANPLKHILILYSIQNYFQIDNSILFSWRNLLTMLFYMYMPLTLLIIDSNKLTQVSYYVYRWNFFLWTSWLQRIVKIFMTRLLVSITVHRANWSTYTWYHSLNLHLILYRHYVFVVPGGCRGWHQRSPEAWARRGTVMIVQCALRIRNLVVSLCRFDCAMYSGLWTLDSGLFLFSRQCWFVHICLDISTPLDLRCGLISYLHWLSHLWMIYCLVDLPNSKCFFWFWHFFSANGYYAMWEAFSVIFVISLVLASAS